MVFIYVRHTIVLFILTYEVNNKPFLKFQLFYIQGAHNIRPLEVSGESDNIEIQKLVYGHN